MANVTSWSHRIVWVVGDPLQLRRGGEGVGDVSEVLQLLWISRDDVVVLFIRVIVSLPQYVICYARIIGGVHL